MRISILTALCCCLLTTERVLASDGNCPTFPTLEERTAFVSAVAQAKFVTGTIGTGMEFEYEQRKWLMSPDDWKSLKIEPPLGYNLQEINFKEFKENYCVYMQTRKSPRGKPQKKSFSMREYKEDKGAGT